MDSGHKISLYDGVFSLGDLIKIEGLQVPMLKGLSTVINQALSCYHKWKPIKAYESTEQEIFPGNIMFHQQL